jgi:hypothetical protein
MARQMNSFERASLKKFNEQLRSSFKFNEQLKNSSKK